MAGKALLRLLIVEDSESEAELAALVLRKSYSRVDHHRVESAGAMRAALEAGGWDLVLADWTVPGFGAAGALRVLQESGQTIPFVLFSGLLAPEAAEAMVREGADAWLPKDDLSRLPELVDMLLASR